MNVLTVNLGPREWITANGRIHWRERARRTRGIRAKTRFLAEQQLRDGTLTRLQRAQAVAVIEMPTSRRSDPGNAAPTVKAIIDGLVDAGVLPDDDRDHLIGPDYRPGPKTGTAGHYRIHLHLTPLPALQESLIEEGED